MEWRVKVYRNEKTKTSRRTIQEILLKSITRKSTVTEEITARSLANHGQVWIRLVAREQRY